jgi:polysaccharide export outer membrane protein
VLFRPRAPGGNAVAIGSDVGAAICAAKELFVTALIASRVPLLAAVIAMASIALPAVVHAQDAAPDSEFALWSDGRYRITPGDVLEITFPFLPEFNQTVAVQPDGYVTLKEIPDIRAQGRTLAQVRADVRAAYASFVREPVFTIALKEFEAPSFVANGAVEKPGRYDLRGPITLTQALALAGGTTWGANTSQVVLYRRHAGEAVEVKQINVQRMFAKKDLSEDPLLQPGDMIVVPKGILGKLAPVLEIVR